MRIPRNTAVAGAEGCVLTVRHNDEGRSVTRISDFLRYRQENEPKEGARVTNPSGSPARRGGGWTRRNPPCLKQGSNSRRVFLIRLPDARLRDKEDKTTPSKAKENLQGGQENFLPACEGNNFGTPIVSRTNDLPHIAGWNRTIVLYDSPLG